MSRMVDRVWTRCDAWLLAPIPGAARRLGYYRILYALFFYWTLAESDPALLAEIPEATFYRGLINRWWPLPIPAWFYHGLTGSLVAALALLLVGFATRLSTAVVFVSGSLLGSLYSAADMEHSIVFLFCFIPLFMLIGGDWGATYSVDAALRRRRGVELAPESEAQARFVLPIRAILVLLAALFCSSGIHKMMPSSEWFTQDGLFDKLLWNRWSIAAVEGYPVNPASYLCADHPWLDPAIRWAVFVFELTFPLILMRRFQALYLSLALLFHAVNGIWMVVTFTPILIVYGLFVDWPRILPERRRGTPSRRVVPGALLIAGSAAFSVAVTALWMGSDVLESGLRVGERLNEISIWYPVLPVALIWFVPATLRAVRGP